MGVHRIYSHLQTLIFSVSTQKMKMKVNFLAKAVKEYPIRTPY